MDCNWDSPPSGTARSAVAWRIWPRRWSAASQERVGCWRETDSFAQESVTFLRPTNPNHSTPVFEANEVRAWNGAEVGLSRNTKLQTWAAIPLRLIVGYGFLAHGYAKLAN